MQIPSLVSLCAIYLPFSEVKEFCFSEGFPSLQEVWREKAFHNFGITRSFFDLYQGGEISSPRQISSFERYLELSSDTQFHSETAVNEAEGSGQIEDFVGFREAVLTHNEDQLEFFFDRMNSKEKTRLIEGLNNVKFLNCIFPQGIESVHLKTLGKVFKLSDSGVGFEDCLYDQFYTWIASRSKRPYETDSYLRKKLLIENSSFFQISRRSTLAPPFQLTIYLDMIKLGNQEAFRRVLQSQTQRSSLLMAVLASGNMSFYTKIRTNVLSIFSSVSCYDVRSSICQAAIFGSNPELFDLFFQDVKFELRLGSSRVEIIKSAIGGYFTHRNLIGIYQILSRFSFSWPDFQEVSLAGLPIDLLDLFCYRGIFSEQDKTRFLFKVLVDNLGYLNVVSFCLSQLELFIFGEEFVMVMDEAELSLPNLQNPFPVSTSRILQKFDQWRKLISFRINYT